MGGGGGSTQNYEASLPFALLAREQWSDYKKRFMPIEKMLISQGLDDSQYLTEPKMAKQAVERSFNAQPEAMGREFSRLGVTMSPAEQMGINNETQLDKTSAMVGLENDARNNVWDRQNSIMSGGLSAVNRALRK